MSLTSRMTRTQALALAADYFDDGRFQQVLARRVACPTESQEPSRDAVLAAYLAEQIVPDLEALGFVCTTLANPIAGGSPFLIAERAEPGASFTELSYGHGDVVRGHAAQWRQGLDPWQLTIEGDRWYGRGTADNKGQHSVNLGALSQVLVAREGRLGYNLKLLLNR